MLTFDHIDSFVILMVDSVSYFLLPGLIILFSVALKAHTN
jgi:hypothetical protein